MDQDISQLLVILFFGGCVLHRRNRDSFAFCVYFLTMFVLFWEFPGRWADYWKWDRYSIWLSHNAEERRILRVIWTPVCVCWGFVFGRFMTVQVHKDRDSVLQFLAYLLVVSVLVWNIPGWTNELFGLDGDLMRLHWSKEDWLLAKMLWGAFALLSGVFFGIWMMRAEAQVPGERPSRWKAPCKIRKPEAYIRKAIFKRKFAAKTFLGIAEKESPVFIGPRERESHMQIVGPTRSGKSQLLLALTGQDMAQGRPVFFMEAKGDRGDFEQFLKLAKCSNRQGALRYFNPQDPRSMTFNPIRRLPGQDSTAVANQIARAIGREPTSTGEGQDYYRAVDYEKIKNMAEIFCAIGREFTLKDCFYYFSYKKARAKAFDLCQDQKIVGIAREGFETIKDSSALAAAFAPWISGTVGRLLNTYSPQIRLEEVFAGRQLAYFSIPVGYLQVLATPLGRMIIAGLLGVASHRQQVEPKPRPAAVYLDEFAEFATPVFSSFIATVGSAKMWTVLSHQDLGQLRKVQGMDQDAFESVVFNNTSGCKVCFRVPDPEDAEFWAAALGTFTTIADTEQIEAGIFGGDAYTGLRSRRDVEAFKIHPNALKSLEPGTAMVISAAGADCLLRTALVFPILNGVKTPSLVEIEGESSPGLELEAAVHDEVDRPRVDDEGVVVS